MKKKKLLTRNILTACVTATNSLPDTKLWVHLFLRLETRDFCHLQQHNTLHKAWLWPPSERAPLIFHGSLWLDCLRKERDGHRYQSHSIYFRCTPLSSFCACMVSCSRRACVCVFSWGMDKTKGKHVRGPLTSGHRLRLKICAGDTVSPAWLVKCALLLSTFANICKTTFANKQFINSTKSMYIVAISVSNLVYAFCQTCGRSSVLEWNITSSGHLQSSFVRFSK